MSGIAADNLGYLFAAYATVWLVLFFYLRSLSRRSRTLERDVEEIEELLRRRGAGSEPEVPRGAD